MIYLDTETIGLTGPVVLIQWGEDDGKVQMVHTLGAKRRQLIDLIERFCDSEVCGFNLTFDWFKLTQLRHMLEVMSGDVIQPAHLAEVYGSHEARSCGLALKPRAALDLMLHARSGPMQSIMERDDVKVRRVPKLLAEDLAKALTETIQLPGIYFARRSDGCAWKVEADPDDEDFPNVYLKFGSAGGLKPLAKYLLKKEVVDFPIPDELAHDPEQWDVRSLWKQEVKVGEGHRTQIGRENARRLVEDHARFWLLDLTAQRYAHQDIDLLRDLRRYWNNPPPGDTNSELACLVGTCRALGFALDPLKAYSVLERSCDEMLLAPRAPAAVKKGLYDRLSPIEQLAVQDTTGETLAALVKSHAGHPAGEFAASVIKSRSAEKRVDMLSNLLKVGYAAWDFKVVGALSNRMSGGGGINCQGVEKGEIRESFLMAQGGDFSGFEVAIAAAAYDDKKLAEDLGKGKKIHALFGAAMYDQPYEVVKNSDKAGSDAQAVPGMGWDGDLYNPAKHGVFAWIYGAQDQKLAETLRLPVDDVAEGVKRFFAEYPDLAAGRKRDQDAFCSMRQPGGLGSRVEWHVPADSVESLFGFKRYFTLENSVCKALYDLSCDPTPELKRWERSKIKVRRREDRIQSPGGAVRSALLGAAFQIQARNMRAAGNHRIQSSGAHITKELQREIWKLQPVGVSKVLVKPWQVHDEVDEELGTYDLTHVAAKVVERFKPVVPLLKMDWRTGLRTWADLK